ncbi:MAG: hypothetical protein ACRDGM_16665 [bacterium]
MGAAVGLAWLGMFIHNVADLPNLTPTSPGNILPGLVWLVLFLVWWTLPGRRWPTGLLFGWGMVNLVGGFASVLPLSILPFRPEQSLRHYAFHVLYAAAQVLLLWLAWAALYSARAHSAPHGSI